MAKVGRPSTYKKKYCDMLKKHMAEGLSFESFAAILGTHRTVIYQWEAKHPDFKDAHRQGKDLAQLYFEKLGLGLTLGKIKGNVSSWQFFCKNRLGWADTVVISSSDNDYQYQPPEFLKPDEAK